MTLEEKIHWLETQLAEALATIAQLQGKVQQLENQLAKASKNSGNSSKPPSSDLTKRPTGGGECSNPRKIGGQPGHPRHERKLFPPEQVDERITHRLKHCPNCGSGNLEKLPEQTEVFQQVELRPKPFVVTEHEVEAGRCRQCQSVHWAEVPEPIARTGLMGPRMRGMLLFMKGAMRGSFSALREFLSDVMGFEVSRGYLAKVMIQGSQAAVAPVEELRSLLPVQRALNVDETGHKENGARMWTWCFRAGNFVVFSIRASRGSEVLIELLGAEFNGVLGCDYFSAYRKFMGTMTGLIQFCLAHLIRDLKYLAEHPDPILGLYAQPILRAVGRMFQLIHQQVDTPGADFQTQLEKQKKRIIALTLNTQRLSPIDWYVEQHYSEVWNMAERFRKHGQSYFTFITTPEIGPTNNAAEQALRFVVMDRKATQGTRGQKGRHFCERMWTVVGTCRMQKRSIYRYLCEAVEAWAGSLPAPSLVPQNSS